MDALGQEFDSVAERISPLVRWPLHFDLACHGLDPDCEAGIRARPHWA